MGKNKPPKKIYLDYNIIVSLQDGEFTVSMIKDLVGTTNVIFPFSASHIEEVRNLKDKNGISRLTVINDRLTFINGLSKKQYIDRTRFDLPYKKKTESAYVVYDILNESPESQSVYKNFMDLITEEQKVEVRNQLGLDSRLLNNIRADQIIDHLNFKMKNTGMSIFETIDHALALNPGNYGRGIENNIVSIFVILDMLGYWKDSISENSNVARLWDASHCALASFCDVLISNDLRMRLKSEVAYNIYGIKTKIIGIK
jgi:hypothetical protein